MKKEIKKMKIGGVKVGDLGKMAKKLGNRVKDGFEDFTSIFDDDNGKVSVELPS